MNNKYKYITQFTTGQIKVCPILTEEKITRASLKNLTSLIPDQEVDLNEILNIVISIIHIPSHVTIKITNKFPTICTDKYRIQQLFQNLISNAVNYSNKKAGKVNITYKDIDDFHLFSIKDNGIGIEKSYHEKIFDIFESYSDDSKSSGIGLSIVKKIIQNYKGEIWLESELNKGSIFYFKIPKVNNGTT